MTEEEYNKAAALVVRLREECTQAKDIAACLEQTNDDLTRALAANVEALVKSNAQCAEYLRHNEMLAADRATLHRELVEVRAALAATTEQRDSLKRTLDEWERADTKPHALIDPPIRMGLISETGPVVFVRIGPKPADDDVADHVVPPVLPMCNVCHECGSFLRTAGSPTVWHCRNERCSRRNTAWIDDESPYHGPCKSATQVRHE